jgi:DNA invertase Pin-like site-specific DNA recombinase
VRVCSEHATREGFHVAERYEDQGISGAAIGNRSGVTRLLEDALGRRFDIVLVTDLCRLSRSQGDLSKMIDRLVAKGIRVVGVQDGYDSARRGHKLQAGLSGIIGEAFREMVKDRTYAALQSRAKDNRPTGGRAYGYRDGTINSHEAVIVQTIFSRSADGASNRTIAAELNSRGVASPGSTWARSERRCAGWMGSGIRVMLMNERYTGRVIWNRSEWVKDPDSGRRIRRERPCSEWICRLDESLRIVSDELWGRVQQRLRPALHEARLKSGGKPKYMLSGLLRCGACDAHYVITNQREYGCASFRDGHACSNSIRVRRDSVEAILLNPIRKDLLAPERVERMGAEMQAQYREETRAMQKRSADAPQELLELNARLSRLRKRLVKGDPDMALDEIQAAIDRAEAKRTEIDNAQPAARRSLNIQSIFPGAAALFRRQIDLGLEGDPRAALEAREILRELFGKKIRLLPQPDGGLIAEWNLQTVALLKIVGTCGSGGALCHVPTLPQRARVK